MQTLNQYIVLELSIEKLITQVNLRSKLNLTIRIPPTRIGSDQAKIING